MKTSRIITGLYMILKMLFRRRIVLLLIVIMPIVFLGVVRLTTSTRAIPFRLASLDETTFIWESLRNISLIFFSLTSTGFLVSFLALSLIQSNSEVNRRLVICGYHPFELLISNLVALLLIIILTATYIGLLINIFFQVHHFFDYIFGLTLIGFVYGCYGLMVGSLVRGRLEGIFLIVMLANIDAGWLQNPMYYAEASNNAIIRFLPAYYPAQSAIIAAFTDYSVSRAAFFSLLYGTCFLVISLMVYYNRMKIRK
jgi:hypothetical protein